MPRIEIDEDQNGHAEFVAQPLKGEDKTRARRFSGVVASASSYVKLSRYYVAGSMESENNLRKAEAKLALLMPEKVAKDLLNALVKNQKGTFAELKFKSEFAEDGTELVSFTNPNVLK